MSGCTICLGRGILVDAITHTVYQCPCGIGTHPDPLEHPHPVPPAPLPAPGVNQTGPSTGKVS